VAYINGTVLDANPGPALHALMAPALTTAGFTLVDTVVISTRTHKVWKSPAASNVQNLDWYLDIGYTTTGAGTIALVAFEMFDPATDLGYRGPYTASSAVIDPATGSRYGAAGFALETNWLPNAGTAGIQTSLTTTAFAYWVSATADRVILMCGGAPTVVMYAGFYSPDPLYAAKAGGLIYPLYAGKAAAGSSSTQSAALTRVPPLTGGMNWQTTVETSFSTASLPQLPGSSTAAYPFVAVPVPVLGTNAVTLGRWGFLRDVYGVPSSGVIRGDTATIGGAGYVLASTSGSSNSLAFKAV